MTTFGNHQFKQWEAFEINPEKKINPIIRYLTILFNLFLISIIVIMFWGIGSIFFNGNIRANQIPEAWNLDDQTMVSLNGVYFEVTSGFGDELKNISGLSGDNLPEIIRRYNLPILKLNGGNIENIVYINVATFGEMWEASVSPFFVIFVVPIAWFIVKIVLLFGWTSENIGKSANLKIFLIGFFVAILIMKLISFINVFRAHKNKLKTAKIQVKINAIKEKYKDAGFMAKQNEQGEINALQTKHGLNPLVQSLQGMAFAPLLMTIFSFCRYGSIVKNSSTKLMNLQNSIWQKISPIFSGTEFSELMEGAWPYIIIGGIYITLYAANIYLVDWWAPAQQPKHINPTGIAPASGTAFWMKWGFKLMFLLIFFTVGVGTSIYWMISLFIDFILLLALEIHFKRKHSYKK